MTGTPGPTPEDLEGAIHAWWDPDVPAPQAAIGDQPPEVVRSIPILLEVVGHVVGTVALHAPGREQRFVLELGLAAAGYRVEHGAWQTGAAQHVSCLAWDDLAVDIADIVEPGDRVMAIGRLVTLTPRGTGGPTTVLQLEQLDREDPST